MPIAHFHAGPAARALQDSPHVEADLRVSRTVAWCAAARPWSLPISIVPVLLGTLLAWRDAHAIALVPTVCALLSSVLIHLGTNLQNDVSDWRRGADGADRIGPPRATMQGWLRPREVQTAATLAFMLSVIPGFLLVVWGGWPILLLGLAAIAAGAAYTAGPYPTGYHGLGEVFVLGFFGVAAVGGSYYLQSFEISAAVLVAGLLIGFLSTAILVANNLRDIDSDARAGKRTLAVRFGRRFAAWEYAMLVLAPFALAVAFARVAGMGPSLLLPVLALLPQGLALARTVIKGEGGAALNPVLASTNRLLLWVGLALCAGILLEGAR